MIFTTILHAVRRQFGLTCNDYCIADMCYRLASHTSPVPGWCNLSRGKMAEEMGLSRRAIIDIVKDLEAKGLIERSENDFLRATKKWIDAVDGCKDSAQGVKKVHTLYSEESSQGVKKLHGGCEESSQDGCEESSQDGCEESSHNNKSIDNKKDNTLPAANAASVEEHPFEDFWKLYPKKDDKKKCVAKWSGLSAKHRALIMGHAPRYIEKQRAAGKLEYLKNPLTYLNAEDWKHGEDLAPPAVKTALIPGNAASHFNPYQQTR